MKKTVDDDVAAMLAACKPPKRELWWIPAGLVGGLVVAAGVGLAVVSMDRVEPWVAIPGLALVIGGVGTVFYRQARGQKEKARRRYDDE